MVKLGQIASGELIKLKHNFIASMDIAYKILVGMRSRKAFEFQITRKWLISLYLNRYPFAYLKLLTMNDNS
jgi:hypothetical protein